jgi:hypothetical protein
MNWVRQNIVTALLGTLVALQAGSALMLFISMRHMEGIRSSVGYSTRYVAEIVVSELSKTVLKVAICDTDGKRCAETTVAKVTTSPNFRVSPFGSRYYFPRDIWLGGS